MRKIIKNAVNSSTLPFRVRNCALHMLIASPSTTEQQKTGVHMAALPTAERAREFGWDKLEE
jgi:hypothetical protein